MARRCLLASSQSLQTASSVSLYSFTTFAFSAWYYIDNPLTGSNQAMMYTVSGSATLFINTNGKMNFWNTNSVSGLAMANVFPTGKWTHVGVNATSGGALVMYINGGSKTSGTTGTLNTATIISFMGPSVTPSGLGATVGLTTGNIAEPTFWSTPLNDAEMLALANGMYPRIVRPTSLFVHWPLRGLLSPEPPGNAGGRTLLLNNAPAMTNHPPITYRDFCLPVGA